MKSAVAVQEASSPSTTSPPTYPFCRYSSTDPATRCSTYRTCEACLQLPGCRVSFDGYCEPDSYGYQIHEDAYDHRRAVALNLTLPGGLAANATALAKAQSWWFPANTTSYCPADNTVCRQCIDNEYWLAPEQKPDSRFCVGGAGTNTKSSGINDCVCIANCVRAPDAVWCPLKSSDDTKKDSGPEVAPFIGLITLALVLFLVTICGCSLLLRCVQTRQTRRRGALNTSHNNQTLASTPVVAVQYREAL